MRNFLSLALLVACASAQPNPPPPAPPTPNPMAIVGNDAGFDMAPETRPEVITAAVAAIPTKLPPGPFQPTWESVKANYQVPAWFIDAKFGVMMHCGLYAVPARHNEWYEKHMYGNAGIRSWHIEKFGPLEKFAYKDFIPLFTAEKFDPEAWAARNVELIEKYQPDLLWFDNGIDIRYLDPLKLHLAAYYYNRARQRGQDVSISTKKAAFAPGGLNDRQMGSIMDFEKVGTRSPSGIRPGAWQVDDAIGSNWGYTDGMRIAGTAETNEPSVGQPLAAGFRDVSFIVRQLRASARPPRASASASPTGRHDCRPLPSSLQATARPPAASSNPDRP